MSYLRLNSYSCICTVIVLCEYCHYEYILKQNMNIYRCFPDIFFVPRILDRIGRKRGISATVSGRHLLRCVEYTAYNTLQNAKGWLLNLTLFMP